MPPHPDLTTAFHFAVAGLAGLAVGIEREWSGHATGSNQRFAGVRTFLLIGLVGGLAGWLASGDLMVLAAVMLAGAMILTAAAYLMTVRRTGAVEGTTEVAAILVLGLGCVSGLGYPLITSAVVSVVVLALAEKTRIHAAIDRLGEKELTAALQFAVLALVILPLLPAGPYGPYDSIRPRAIWIVVLLFSALNFAAYLLGRWLGAGRGYAVTGLVGGLVSSTAVTWQFSRRSKEEPELGRGLALGVLGACSVLPLRVGVIASALNLRVGLALIPYLVPPLVVAAVILFLGFRRRKNLEAERGEPEAPPNPLRLGNAIRMALAFQVVLILIPVVQHLWGSSGVLASAAILGLTDVDALTFSMTRLGDAPHAVELGARAIAIGIISNTVLKLAFSLIMGRGVFRKLAPAGLVILGVASGAGMWLGGVWKLGGAK
jgi:uncharacterized membrane protein (DUF4010 family)